MTLVAVEMLAQVAKLRGWDKKSDKRSREKAEEKQLAAAIRSYR